MSDAVVLFGVSTVEEALNHPNAQLKYITVGKLALAIEKLKKANRRLTKAGVTDLFRLAAKQVLRNETYVYEVYLVVPAFPGIDGWDLVAVFKKIPDSEYYDSRSHAAGFLAYPLNHFGMEDIVYPDEMRCDKCNARRGRNSTYQVQKDGVVMYVGGSCLQMYVGIPAAYWSIWTDFDEEFSDEVDEEMEETARREGHYAFPLFEQVVAASYLSELGTKHFYPNNTTIDTIVAVRESYRSGTANPDLDHNLLRQSHEYAMTCLSWVQNLPDSEDVWEMNMRMLTRSPGEDGVIWVPDNLESSVHMIPSTYRKKLNWDAYQQRLREAEAEKAAAVKENREAASVFPKVGTVLKDVEVHVTRVHSYDKGYGPRFIYDFTARNVPFVWFTSVDLPVEKGDKLLLGKATVKEIKLNTYTNLEQVVLTRCKAKVLTTTKTLGNMLQQRLISDFLERAHPDAVIPLLVGGTSGIRTGDLIEAAEKENLSWWSLDEYRGYALVYKHLHAEAISTGFTFPPDVLEYIVNNETGKNADANILR